MPRSGMPHLPKRRTNIIPVPCKCVNGHEFDSVDALMNDMKCPICKTDDWKILKKVI